MSNTHNAPTRHTTPAASLRPVGRLRRVVIGAAVAATSLLGVVALDAPAVSAVSNPLPTNAMAPVVTSSARQALDSYNEWMATDDPAAERSYVWFRTQTAQYAAIELGYPQADMVTAWAAAPIQHQHAVLAAMTQLGVPYRYNTSSEGVGFDCSGLTTFAWANAGVPLVRQSGAQINNAASVDRSTANAGDLVHYPGHVMMYLGVGDAIVHSVQTGRTVELDTISSRMADRVRFGNPIG